MSQSQNNSAPVLSFLLEHSHGTCELWVRCTGLDECTYEPVKLVPISGKGTILLNPATIDQAISLDEWVADHFEVFSEGRTVFDSEI